ncbi:MAG: peptide chain release factor-like protein [Phycisphaerales bacterium]|nr:peptide chain release factor-like protein [Phycisphaerales bacterium]
MTFDPIMIDGRHPATLEDGQLLKQCAPQFGRSSGPGGQHRNRRSTATTLVHEPTGLHGTATERRSQAQNRSVALRRLRLTLALRVRTSGPFRGPSPLWTSRRQGRQMSINPRHRDYPALLAEAMDCLLANRWDVAKSAGALGISMSQMTKLLRHHGAALEQVNQIRQDMGLPRLRR